MRNFLRRPLRKRTVSVRIGILGIIITRIGLIRMNFRRTRVFEESEREIGMLLVGTYY